MHDSSADRDPVERLAEEFLERKRRGEQPRLTEYVGRYPEWAAEIRDLFPALVMMERLKPAAGDVTGSFIGEASDEASRVPERLGDFRILREIGRGGMGIVYEAQQESLDRHVALKVLPSHALLDSRLLHRFRREAKSAARLHHTNIVPVFGVGEDDGLHYYAMQLISGSGLQEVIDELRRLRSADRTTEAADAGSRKAASRGGLARSLLTGDFSTTVAVDFGVEPPEDGPRDIPDTSATQVSAGGSILSDSGKSFAREVARIGLQVAEALGYAHGQGVLHRDIKPANLLLDVQGTVWVADFGLAKAMVDTDDLTGERDILGTLRYMAPERFHGEADARSDLYALGLTLYELLTLRPAFDQTDRDRLILQVTTGVPPRPRTINRQIPRDLETIVLKAMEHDPARRYQDAKELADDLERFLADRPIQARRVGVLEQAQKWARRKPAIAGLVAALVLAVVAGFAGVTWQWRQAVASSHVARLNEKKARTNFKHALETVNTFFTQVSEEQLLNQPGMQPLRRQLLNLARKYYQTFQRQEGDDRELMWDLALSFVRSGVIANELGDASEAQIALLRARDIMERLHRLDPDDDRVTAQFARCYIEIEDADRMNDFAHTGTTGHEADGPVLLTRRLVAKHPENAEYRRLLGRSFEMYGIQQLRRGQYAGAEASFKDAIAMLERARAAAPNDVEAKRWLALAHADLGLVAQQAGRHGELARSLGRALVILDSIEIRLPTSRVHRLDRAECLVKLGTANLDLGRYGEAEARLREAHDRLGRLAREDPKAVDVRYWLAVAQQGLGRLALARGQTSASDWLRRAIAPYENVPAQSPLAGRDHLALAWSYLWLSRAELDAGHTASVSPLNRRLVDTLDRFKQQLMLGMPMPQQNRELMELEDLVGHGREPGTASPVETRRRELRARRARAGQNPADLDIRFEVAMALVELANVLGKDGLAAEAGAALDEAIKSLKLLVRAEPENCRWRQGLARAWETLGRVQLRAGQLAEARASAGEAVALAEELATAYPSYAYDLACALILRASATSSEPDAVAAVGSLRRAIGGGFDNTHRLLHDPRLDGLRSRPDFPTSVGASK